MIKSTQKLSVLLMLAGTLFTANAQEQVKLFGKPLTQKLTPSGHIRCASTEYENYLKEKYPNRATTAQFEQWIAPKIEELKTRRTAFGTNNVVTIPVVVHVIHNGDALGVDENIADEQVLSQITVLNQDYRRMVNTPGYNTNPVGADMEIQFALAQVDPQGNPTNGIHRVNLNRSSWNTENQVEGTMKPQTSWDPTRYFNIWVCKFGGTGANGLSTTLGYAQFPSGSQLGGLFEDEGPANTDGVVIGYKYFGSIALYPQGTYDATYNRGRTATHEIGHSFGLRHIDGDETTCSYNAQDTTKDYCPDTPVIREQNYVCSPINSCPSAPGNDMIENYMDYTPDACMNIFTQNQKSRMLTVLQNSPRRASLVNSTVWMPLGTDSFSVAFQNISLYPNPATDVINISVGSELPDAYVIYNSLGQTVAQSKISGEANLAINTSAYSNGIYFVKVTKGNQEKTLKFVKN